MKPMIYFGITQVRYVILSFKTAALKYLRATDIPAGLDKEHI